MREVGFKPGVTPRERELLMVRVVIQQREKMPYRKEQEKTRQRYRDWEGIDSES